MSEAERLNFSIANRYQIKKCIGKGSFATVYVADDTQNPPRKVAVKRIKHVFDDVAEAKRLLRETSIMHRIRHPNLVWIRDLYIPDQNEGDYNNIFIIMDCFQTDLKKLIHSPVFLEHSQVKFFLYQIVCGVRYLHSANILHRDLKPANILVNEDCTIHICDFGLSRSYSSLCQDMQQVEEIVAVEQTEFQLQAGGIQMRNLSRDNRIRKAQKKFTKHVVTRWYRAPEVILMEQEYDKTLDVWSIGCIYAELLGMIQGNTAGHEMRQPFFPGKSCFPLSPDLSAQLSRAGFPNSTHDQIKVIMEVLGTPSEEDLSFVSDPRALEYIQSFQQCTGKPFEQSFPVSDPKELDLLRSMLKFNPQKRITLDDLIQDSYFDDIRQPQRELICEQPLDLSWDFDNNITCDELRRIFRSEIASNFPSSSQSQ